MSSCKILYINRGVGVGGFLTRLGCHWLVWKGSAVWLEVTDCCWQSSQHHGTRWWPPAPALLSRNQTVSVVTFHPLNNQLFFTLLLLGKAAFFNAPWTGFLVSSLAKQNYKKTTKKQKQYKTLDCGRILQKSGVRGTGCRLPLSWKYYIFLRNSF